MRYPKKSYSPFDGRGSSASSILPARSAADLKTVVAALSVLATAGHDRMTVQQALFFLAAAYHGVMGQSATVTRIREIYQPLGRSVEKSSLQFLAPGRVAPDALGWLEQHHDPDDRRVRYLHLTEDGEDVVAALVEAMRSA